MCESETIDASENQGNADPALGLENGWQWKGQEQLLQSIYKNFQFWGT